MAPRIALTAVVALLFAMMAGARGNADVSKPPHARHANCGPALASPPYTDPPVVVVSQLPIDASGNRELRLAVHRDDDRFCYRYKLSGAVQTVAPTIRVHRGEAFDVRIINDIAGPSKGESIASDAIPPCLPMAMPASPAVRYVGYLNHQLEDRWMPQSPLDVNVHFHGFQGPADQENIFLSTLSMPAHACEYHLIVPRSQPPGTYFYHPHVHGASGDQVAGGLAGTWIVEPDTPQIAPAAEHIVALRYRWPFGYDNMFAPDITPVNAAAAAHQAALKSAPPVPYDPFNPPAWPISNPMRARGLVLDPSGCNGVQSESLIVVNGYATPASLDVPAGQTQLLRIVNQTSDSAKPLSMRDAAGNVVPMHVVEFDGNPVGGDPARPLSRYVAANEIMLPIAGRASVLVTVDVGRTVTLTSGRFCAGSLAAYQMPHDLLRVTGIAPAGAGPVLTIESAPVVAAGTPAAELVAYAQAHPSEIRRRAMTFTQYYFPARGKIPIHKSFFLTDTTNSKFREHVYHPIYRAGATVPSNVNVVVKRGAIEEWYLFNTTIEIHTFHMHQMAFVALAGPAGQPAMVDTTFIPVGTVLPNAKDPNYPLMKPSVTKVLLDFRKVPRGTFVFHCHNLFHEDRGMMGIIRVE